MAKVPTIKPKLRIGERFGKGLGSVFNYLSPSMQLSALKIMKKMHPVYADSFIYDLARKFAWERSLPPQLKKIGYGKKDNAARQLRGWVFDNVKHEPYNKVTIGWPKLLEYTLRKHHRENPYNFIKFSEDYVKYMETDEYKYDMALQDQKLNKELTELEIKKSKFPRLDPENDAFIVKGPEGDEKIGRYRMESSATKSKKTGEWTKDKRYKVYDWWDEETQSIREEPKFIHMIDDAGKILLKQVKNMGGLFSLIS